MNSIRNTSSKSYRQLMGNGTTYTIPKFQRDYSWDIEQWDDLWLDILNLEQEEEEHYMGYLVLQTSDNQKFKIIDGQQRITTLSILILSTIKCLEDLVTEDSLGNNIIRANNLRGIYIGTFNNVTMLSKNKLQLNKNGDHYYSNYLVPLQDLPLRKRNESEKRMRSCFLWYYKIIKATYKTGEELAAFIESFVHKLYFTVIEVNNTVNAYKVFETLNARGVQLSSADLLKNYLFSIVDKEPIEDVQDNIDGLENHWSETISQLGNRRIDDYLRYFWNSKNKTVRKNQLFKAIKSEITTAQEVFQLLRDLKKNVALYIAIQEPQKEADFWEADNSKMYYRAIQPLEELKLFGVKQTYSLLMTAYNNLSDKLFVKLLKFCSIIAFRYNVVSRLNANEQERVYNELTLFILKTKQIDYKKLAQLYVNKEEFIARLKGIEFKRSRHKLVRYILATLEQQQHEHEIDYTSSAYTVEHILPEKTKEEAWSDFEDDDKERFIYRLGNLTLLEKKKNEKLGNLSYDKKLEIYKVSSCQLTQNIPVHYEEWGPMQVNRRQQQLAKLAAQAWRAQELEQV